MNTNIPQVPLSDVNSDMQTSPAFPFLKLPQELRDQVYENLLCPHIDGTQHRRVEKIRDYGLEPSILRTCKQVCQEASTVLYSKNSTVLIRMDALAYQILQSRRFPSFPEEYAFARVEGGEAANVAVFTMEISVLEEYRVQKRNREKVKVKGRGKAKAKAKNSVPEEQDLVFIGFMPALPKICRLITSCGFAEIMQLVIHMERLIGRSPKTRLQVLSDCLESFREARGLGRAVIFTEPQHSASAAEIADLMMTHIQAFDEAFGIVRAYEARVLRQLKEKRWNDAQATLQNALDFFHSTRYTYHPSQQRGTTNKKRHEFEVKLINTQWNYVSCCLRIGRTGDALHQIRQMFLYDIPRNRTQAQQEGYWDRAADAYYAIGKAYTIDGFLNSAVHSFLQALLTAPGHVDADRAIDDLEERVKSSSKPEDVRAKLNIECIPREVRHPVPGQHRLTGVQVKQLIEGFTATYSEIQRLILQRENTSVSTLGTLASKFGLTVGRLI